IAADLKFHGFLYELSGNPLVAPAMEAHLAYAQRVMGEVLMRDEKPRDVWDQHERILDAIVAGQGEQAEALVRRHVGDASSFMVARLRGRVAEAVPR
ncbi:MAG: FCD domain-containing protein, partial [Aquabacterium sp.]